jgi:hypothetical protein
MARTGKEDPMKIDIIRKKAYLVGASGILTFGAAAGVVAAAHPALAAPSVSAPDTGDTVEAVEGPQETGTVQVDAAGGHTDAATTTDNQHQGEGNSDG